MEACNSLMIHTAPPPRSSISRISYPESPRPSTSHGTVMSRLSRGKAQLRELLCVDRTSADRNSAPKVTVADEKDHHG